MPVGRIFPGALTLIVLFGSPMSSIGSRAVSRPQPPVSYICTMDADVLADQPGVCPICKMDLEPTRIETAWSCPVHAAVIKYAPGECEFDHRELVPVTIDHFWTCPGDGKGRHAGPGRCADGQPRQERKMRRAHGDHNPRHGGQFFMAGDRWHHLEGTYPAVKVFRLYLYDNFTNVLDLKKVSGRVFTREDAGRELDPVPLVRSKDGATLEARIEAGAFPQRVTAKLTFSSSATEERFDFTFQETTRDAAGAPWATRRERETTGAAVGGAPPRALSRPVSNNTVPRAPAIPQAAPSADAPPRESPWPGSIPDALTVLEIRAREILTLIDQGNFLVVYAPTMLAKDLALSVADHVDEVPAEGRDAMIFAVRRVVLAAWRLDRFGDLGDRARLVQAHADFALAVSDMKVAYATP